MVLVSDLPGMYISHKIWSHLLKFYTMSLWEHCMLGIAHSVRQTISLDMGYDSVHRQKSEFSDGIWGFSSAIAYSLSFPWHCNARVWCSSFILQVFSICNYSSCHLIWDVTMLCILLCPMGKPSPLSLLLKTWLVSREARGLLLTQFSNERKISIWLWHEACSMHPKLKADDSEWLTSEQRDL